MDINRNTAVEDIVRRNPKAIEVFKRFNIEIVICGEIVWDNLGDLCEKHGVNVEIILSELKKLDG